MISMIYTRLAWSTEVHAPILLIIPFCLEIPTLIPWTPLLLTWNPSFVSWREFPSTRIPGWLYTDPPLSSPFPFPLPQWLPISNTCPPTTTLRYRLQTVRYSSLRQPFKVFMCFSSNLLRELGTQLPIILEILRFSEKYLHPKQRFSENR
jgi:hypothetical protein